MTDSDDNRLARLEQSIDDFRRSTGEVLAALTKSAGENRERLVRIETKIDAPLPCQEHRGVLYGNGKEGLITRVTELERRAKDLVERTERIDQVKGDERITMLEERERQRSETEKMFKRIGVALGAGMVVTISLMIWSLLIQHPQALTVPLGR